MTEKLYYIDSHVFKFTARVTACVEDKGGFRIALDKTAFFPEGGGQLADTGRIGALCVRDVHERDGEVWHYTDAPLPVGGEYECELDREQRLRRMQNHSGEHIVSGIVHALFGADNVGFHMGEECMTIDFNAELSWEQLETVERRANETVRADLPVLARFPDASELETLEYRSKLDLTENVRIVEIPGVDCCACCAPHVARTGEIGLIKLLDSVRHRGGVRISLVCGMDALDTVRDMQQNVTAAGRLLSAKRSETAAAVQRLIAHEQTLKERIGALGMAYARLLADGEKAREGNICVFDSILDEAALRELANLLRDKCTGYAAVFSGDDERGYRYIIASRSVDLRAAAKEINFAIGGRGGGKSEMIEGRAAKPRAEIRRYVENQLD